MGAKSMGEAKFKSVGKLINDPVHLIERQI